MGWIIYNSSHFFYFHVEGISEHTSADGQRVFRETMCLETPSHTLIWNTFGKVRGG